MKLQFGKNQLVLELSASPFAWFHGQTERMSLTSLSLLFVQFSCLPVSLPSDASRSSHQREHQSVSLAVGIL